MGEYVYLRIGGVCYLHPSAVEYTHGTLWSAHAERGASVPPHTVYKINIKDYVYLARLTE